MTTVPVREAHAPVVREEGESVQVVLTQIGVVFSLTHVGDNMYRSDAPLVSTSLAWRDTLYWRDPMGGHSEPAITQSIRQFLHVFGEKAGRTFRLERHLYIPVEHAPQRPEDVPSLRETEKHTAINYRLFENDRFLLETPRVHNAQLHAITRTTTFPLLLALRSDVVASDEAAVRVAVGTITEGSETRLRIRSPLAEDDASVLPVTYVDWDATLLDPTRDRLVHELGAYARSLRPEQQSCFAQFLHEHGINPTRVNLAALTERTD